MSYAATVLADAPVGYWRLDEPSGVTAADSSGNSLASVYVGLPTLGASSPISDGYAVGFNGSTQYVTLPTNALLNITADISVETWVKFTSSGVGYVVLGFDGTPNGYALVTNLGTAGASIVGSLAFGTFPGGGWFGTTATNWNDGAWHHFVASLSGSTLRLYKDGVLDATHTGVAAPATYLGPRYLAYLLDGSLDESAIYSSALSGARVAAHYDARNGLLVGGSSGIASSSAGLAGLHSLQGTSAAVSSGAAAAGAVHALAATAADVSAATAWLRLTDDELGVVHGTAGVHGSLQATYGMAGATGGESACRLQCIRSVPFSGFIDRVPLVNDDGYAMPSVFGEQWGIMEVDDVANLVMLVDC